jgi:exosortase A-associated hydrolase 1
LGEIMRHTLSFACEGADCHATLDGDTQAATGLFIVSGGNEIRIGSHRGMAKLAADIAAEGYSCFRFDRRGIGDSDGENAEFEGSAADISAAMAAYRAACPHLTRVIAFGNCDAASALLLHGVDGIDAYVLGNIWVIEARDEMPPPAAIKARYLERIKDPKSWVRLFSGAINLKKLAGGLFKVLRPAPPSSLPLKIAQGLAKTQAPVTILLAKGDATAIAFADVWRSDDYAQARSKANISVATLDSASHSFASDEDYSVLKSTIHAALAAKLA